MNEWLTSSAPEVFTTGLHILTRHSYIQHFQLRGPTLLYLSLCAPILLVKQTDKISRSARLSSPSYYYSPFCFRCHRFYAYVRLSHITYRSILHMYDQGGKNPLTPILLAQQSAVSIIYFIIEPGEYRNRGENSFYLGHTV